jgi:dihydroflavonol-4-reductase
VVGPDYSGSIQLVKQLLDGGMPGVPRLSFGVVDVRDLADLHMRHDRRQGRAGPRQRRRQHDHAGHRARAEVPAGRRGRPRPAKVLPNWVVRLASLVQPELKQVVPQLGKVRNSTSEKARRVLGWAPRSNEDTIVDTGESLARLGNAGEAA